MRKVSTETLGAWLLKCNADHSDIAERAARGEHPRRLCVQRSYRTDLMRAGQKVVFWVSGSRGGPARGIWGAGTLTGPPAPDFDGPGPRLRVPLDLRLWAEPDRITRDTLRADGRLADLEVFRQPQAANPSFVTIEQLRVIEEHADRMWP